MSDSRLGPAFLASGSSSFADFLSVQAPELLPSRRTLGEGSAADLDGLKGVGPSLSKRILDARAQGEFKDWGDFMSRVKGVKAKAATKLSGQGLTVNGKSFDDTAFVGMNVALIAFLVSLVAESTWMMRVATPVLGLSILAGLADRAITTRSPGRPLPLAPA